MALMYFYLLLGDRQRKVNEYYISLIKQIDSSSQAIQN